MFQSICVVVLLPATGAFVPTPDKPAPALTGLPPVIHAVTNVDPVKGVVLVEKTVLVELKAVEARPEVFLEPYQELIQPETVRQESAVFPVKDGKVQTANGKDLSAAEALKRLKAGMPILTSADGNPVSPGYLAIFQPDTIVLIPPGQAVPLPPPSPPLTPPAKKE